MSQKTAILDMLKRGPVTPLDALSKLGCFPLAAVSVSFGKKAIRSSHTSSTRATRISHVTNWNSARAEHGKKNAS